MKCARIFAGKGFTTSSSSTRMYIPKAWEIEEPIIALATLYIETSYVDFCSTTRTSKRSISCSHELGAIYTSDPIATISDSSILYDLVLVRKMVDRWAKIWSTPVNTSQQKHTSVYALLFLFSQV